MKKDRKHENLKKQKEAKGSVNTEAFEKENPEEKEKAEETGKRSGSEEAKETAEKNEQDLSKPGCDGENADRSAKNGPETADTKVDELTDRLKRLMAEFDNFRKRTEKEKAAQFDRGAESTLLKILPVVDNFERGLQSVPEDERDNAVYDGMDKIYKQLMKALSDMGVEPINAEGKPFDPAFHNAVLQVENDELPENTVAAELQKGYLYKGGVLRHSMVSVVQ